MFEYTIGTGCTIITVSLCLKDNTIPCQDIDHKLQLYNMQSQRVHNHVHTPSFPCLLFKHIIIPINTAIIIAITTMPEITPPTITTGGRRNIIFFLSTFLSKNSNITSYMEKWSGLAALIEVKLVVSA